MADIYQMPPNTAFDPIMDLTLGPMPLWLIVILVLFLSVVLINVWWFIKFMIMAPVRGAGVASKATGVKTQQAFMFGKNRSFSIQALEYVDGILSYKDPTMVSKWMLTSPTSVGKVGFKPVFIASDNFDCIRDPISEMAVCRIAKEINTKNPDIAITNNLDFMAFIPALESAYPDGIPIPIYALYSPEEVQKYTPRNRTAAMFGAMILKLSNELNIHIPDESFWEKNIKLLLFVGAGVIAMAMTFLFGSGAAGKAPI
jgi:hypothetical protein